MFTEKGTLPDGIEYDGTLHSGYEIREQLVGDAISVFDDADVTARAVKNPQYLSVCVLANMLVSLGSIPKDKITGDLLMSMSQDNFNELRAAEERLDAKRKSFRAENKK
ncbi:MAG: hypothetical protein CVU74_01120 [Deltaproteobacteria bacterium HGW-Deltaproteobacteria-9]|jgi:hypothetical protein|nr:MAG: hypothetical protein CVU74_01120 [Deltaproteobacteria bacterium HGW-Deltaproteobacteria-9]